MVDATVAVVGAGLAGFQVASALRDQHYPGRVVLVGDESHRPYHRPPLSKGYLLGSADDAAVDMRPATYYSDKQIELLTATRAATIDRTHRKLALDNGTVIDYHHLVLAVGARNRLLHVPGSDLAGVFYLRHLDEARALRAALGSVKRALVVGAGFIGLEFAAAAVKIGCRSHGIGRCRPRHVACALDAHVQSVRA
jgi:3-phenylpropionate/trans-cinnamate dioxygenase ferredoxin reductase subunit